MSLSSLARPQVGLALTVVAVAVASSTTRLGHADAPAGRYVVDTATVKDTATGLMWQRVVGQSKIPATSTCPDGSVCDGQSYCAALTVDGIAGWRMPTVNELLTIVDETRVQPAIDSTAFPSTPTDDLFDTHSSYSEAFPEAWWGVQFDYGLAKTRYLTTPGYVRCVQGYGAN